ncbi:NAD(P)/FAD-dependent oxidoreductase [Neolewinella persica]|uniref:NAD(P)/FAD-dependent oxidoreductase n=1 Tax=Neolewinella persica TaxID=70998 RepID=UPI0003A0024F|nr:NAD(P)/FAD-dependent oxidoreductase [Neolewinella persica]
MKTENVMKTELNIPATDLPRVVVIGGGFGGLNFIKQLDNVHYQVVLFDRNNFHTFIPLLYQVATAGLEAPSIVGPLRKALRRKQNFHFRMLAVRDIKPEAKVVVTSAGSVSYDHLVIATGTEANFFGNTEIAKLGLPLKTLADARRLRNHLFQTLERLELTSAEEERQRLLTFLIVGGGPTGVEMAGALAELRDHVLKRDYPDSDIGKMRIILAEGSDQLLAAFSDRSSEDARADLEAMGVELFFGQFVEHYDGSVATFKGGEKLPCATLIWGAGVKGCLVPGLVETAVARSQYQVDDHLLVNGYDNIYALGDVAHRTTEDWPRGYPGVAQVAIQMGERLAKNLNAQAAGKEATPFTYLDKGNMATIGRNKAVADLANGWHFRGFLAWISWVVVHLYYLIGFRNRMLTLYSWVSNYFTYSRSIRLVMEPTLEKELVDETDAAKE